MDSDLEHLQQSVTQGVLGRPLVRPSSFEACICQKVVEATAPNLKKYHSGLWRGDTQVLPGVNYWGLLCPDCRREFDGWPRLVCLGCRRLVGFIKPAVEKCGFKFERGKHYHIADCPQCNPARDATPILEYEQFLRDMKIPAKADADILQEIEQKKLQGVGEAAKLRAEFNLRPS